MAPLILQFDGKDISCELRKVDRSQLYGALRTEARDAEGRRCRLATLASDGHTLIDSGGTAMAYLAPDNTWRDKSALKPVDSQGREIAAVPSSFKQPIALESRATIDEYLAHNVTSAYVIHADLDERLLAELKGGAIFKFPFSYRGGLSADAAFLLLSAEGLPWMMVAKPATIAFVDLEETEAPQEMEDAETEEEDDSMDFGMM